MHVYIEDIGKHEGEDVTIKGWLHNRRSSGKIHFLILRDGSGFIQAVMSKAAVGDELFRVADHLSQETSVIVTGTVRADTRAPSGYEIDVKHLEVVGLSHDFPITPKEHGVDYLLDRRHLWIRSERQQAILRVRHEIINAVRDFFNSRGFILADTPIFTPAACEGTTTLFPVQYFEDTTAFLTQSGVGRCIGRDVLITPLSPPSQEGGRKRRCILDDEPRDVPELISEVLVAADLVLGNVHVSARGVANDKRHTPRVRAEFLRHVNRVNAVAK